MKNLFALLLFTLCSWGQATQFQAKVVGVSDGDTYKVLAGDRMTRIRLDHVDSPEKGQPFGKAAKKFGSDFCFGRIVTVKTRGKRDRYDRLIAEIYLGNKCLNKELVRRGLAWHFTRYSRDRGYAGLQTEARAARAGLWRDPASVPPWEWRKLKREKRILVTTP